jgi:hypothetical protein
MGTYKVWLGQGRIIYGYIEGVHTREDAENMINEVFKLAEEDENLNRLLVDLSNIDHSSMGSRRVHAENMKNERMENWKVALIGANTVTKVMANFIIRVSGCNDKFKLFESKNDAVNWLLE